MITHPPTHTHTAMFAVKCAYLSYLIHILVSKNLLGLPRMLQKLAFFHKHLPSSPVSQFILTIELLI